MDCNLAKAQSDVVGDHKPAAWLDALSFLDLGGDKLGLAAVTGAAVVMIALLAAVASQIDNYYKLMKGRTLITIAHRLSTIRHVDKTIVLKGGVVAEQGTHDELMRLDGVHAELYGTQVQPAAPTGA